MTHDAEMCNFYMMYAYNSSLEHDQRGTREALYRDKIDPALWPRYPPEAMSLLPTHETLEASAKGTTTKFGWGCISA